jgi:hypothetical protein
MALHPLTAPEGWRVTYHQLADADPGALPADHPDWALLEEDLLQVRHLPTGALLDVGWGPPGRSGGRYTVRVVLDANWQAPLARRTAASLPELDRVLAELFADPTLLPAALPTAEWVARLGDPRPEVRADAGDRLADRGELEAFSAVEEAFTREYDPRARQRLGRAFDTLVRLRKASRAEPKRSS